MILKKVILFNYYRLSKQQFYDFVHLTWSQPCTEPVDNSEIVTVFGDNFESTSTLKCFDVLMVTIGPVAAPIRLIAAS